MSNGGSPPAPLPPSARIPTNPSGWLRYKWSQPPPRAPNRVFQFYQVHNPPYVPHNKDWLERPYREDLQAAGLLTPDATPRFPLGWRMECAYQVWKWTVDLLWEAVHRCQQQFNDELEEAACQKRLHAKYHQHLLDKRAAQARHEALVRGQCLVAEVAAMEREMATVRTIFLWFRPSTPPCQAHPPDLAATAT